MPIEVVVSATAERLIVGVRGDVDAASADYLKEIIDGADEADCLVVDLSGSDFVDIAGMRAIASCSERRTVGGRELIVAAPPPSAETLLRMPPWRGHLRWEPRPPLGN